jgi:hypothetical protein
MVKIQVYNVSIICSGINVLYGVCDYKLEKHG